MILQWLASPEWANIIKALLHTLWQGAAIAVLLGFALRRLGNPAARYRCSLAALGGVLLAGMVTWAVLNRPLPQPIPTVPAPQTQPASAPLPNSNTLPPLVVNFSPPEPKAIVPTWSAWLALVWLAGATAMIFRGGFQVAGAERLRRSARPLEDARIAGLLEDARQAVGLARRVRLVATDKLTSPAVVGVLVPTLILPLSLTTTLTPEQIRFVLLHELAHIRRGDYFASLFQLFAEALLFFNPAVWWISRQMRLEREACCDTLAVELSGAPAAYARTLVRVAENVLQPAPAAAPAFGDKREPSSLADRVQRMLVPGYRPKLRLTWRAMLLALFVGGGLLFLSALGTRVTVAAILSPQQRIAKIEQKMTELGASAGLNFTYAEAEKAPKIAVSGRVRVADGSPLPKDVWLNALSVVGGSSSGTGFYLGTNGTFRGSLTPGQIILSMQIPNFAPAQIGPVWCVGTNPLENIEIVVTPGFKAPIQLVDAVSGKPVADGKLSARFWLRGGNQTGFRETPLTTDGSGMATLTHAADLPLVVTVNTPGYEILDKKFPSVAEGQPLRVELQPGRKVSGVVRDKTSGQPIAGATIQIRFEQGPNQGAYGWDDTQRILATTDAQGKFEANQLRTDTVYWLGVSAAKHESIVLPNIRPNRTPLEAKLGPEIIVKGRITGKLDHLEDAWGGKGRKALAYTIEDRTTENRCDYGERTGVRIENGVGYFEFTNRYAANVVIHAPGQTVERNITGPVDDWLINLTEAAKTEAKDLPQREVVFRFKHPSGVPPRGTVRVLVPSNLEPNHGSSYYREMEITNGEVRVPIAIGGRTEIESKHLVGYFFNRAGRWTSPTGESGDWLSIEVRSNSSPLVIEVPLIPAGAIYARAKNADGTPAGGLFFGVSELKRAPGRDQNSLDGGGDSVSGDAPRQWISGPLPLGGTYQINGWRGNSFCVSQPIKLTEASPDAEVELQFPPDKTFDGMLLDADSNPLRDAEVKASFSLPDNHGFGLKSVFTDELGRFHLEHLTPDFGTYTVEVTAPGMMTERLKLKVGSQSQTIRLQRGRTLAGRVVEAGTGYPIPGMEVRALDYESNKLPMQTSHTDADGRFEFTSLGDANYTLYPDGGELLDRPASGNLKFRADGRTNLTLRVKLYEWSKLKPKAPDATVVTTNISMPVSKNDTGQLVQDGKLLYEMGKWAEAEAKLKSALAADPNNAVAKYYLGLVQSSRQNPKPNQIKLGRQNIVEKLDHIHLDRVIFQQSSLANAVRQLNEAAVKNDPAKVGVNITVATNSISNPAADISSVVLKIPLLVDVRLSDVLDAIVMVADQPIKYSILDSGIVFSAKGAETSLFMRTFKLDTNVFYTNLQISGLLRTNSFMPAIKYLFSDLGVNLNSPPGKSVFFNDGKGILFVEATESDLDTIERALSVLSGVPPQIHIKARFYEVPKGTLLGFQNMAVSSNSAAQVTGILNATNAQTVLRSLQARSGVEVLAEPEVTTTSGRQTQMRVTQVVTVVTNMVFQDSFTNQDGAVVTNAIVPQTSKVETGPVLDVVPHVLSDGCTINLALIPSVTEFLGYDKSTNTTAACNRAGEKIDVPEVLPRFTVRQATATLNLWDGQTAVLGGLPEKEVVGSKKTVVQPKANEKELLVFITASIIDPAGNRVHTDEELPFTQTSVPPQPK